MNPVFKCEYCNFIGTEEEVAKHEETCFNNYNKRSCMTCTHRGFKSVYQYKCACGKDIPVGQVYENCELYIRGKDLEISLNDVMHGLFGGF